MLISDWMLQDLQSEAPMSRRLLERVTTEKLDWKPAEDLHTIGWNAAHLVDSVGWLPGILNTSELDLAPPGAEPMTIVVPEDAKTLLDMFDKNVAASISALQGVADAKFDETWSLKMGGQTYFTMPKGACIQKWVFSHVAHHRGILSVYLRLAGIKFSSIYEE